MYVYKVISHAGPILFCNIQHSGLFCLFVIYDEVRSPGLVHFLPGQPALETPTSPLPFLQFLTNIGIRYMNDMKNYLPCWGKCKLRYWIYNRHNPNTKTVLPKIISSLIHFPDKQFQLLASFCLHVHQGEAQNSRKLLKGT